MMKQFRVQVAGIRLGQAGGLFRLEEYDIDHCAFTVRAMSAESAVTNVKKFLTGDGSTDVHLSVNEVTET